jgi:hypothetical protein
VRRLDGDGSDHRLSLGILKLKSRDQGLVFISRKRGGTDHGRLRRGRATAAASREDAKGDEREQPGERIEAQSEYGSQQKSLPVSSF